MEDKSIIPFQTSRVLGGVFVGTDQMDATNINMKISGTILSRYWKGIEGDHSNGVIEIWKLEKFKK